MTIDSVWAAVRRRFCPKRIYRWGTVGLAYFDDRTWLEKVCDKVDAYLMERRDRIRYERAHIRQAWHSFYSMSMGCVVDSPAKIRDWERKGYAWARPEEFDEAANKAQQRIEAEQNRKIRAKVEHAAREIANGRSYIKEQRQRMEKAKRS